MHRFHRLTRKLAVVLTIALTGCSSAIDDWKNTVTVSPPYRANSNAAALHRSLHIVDLHADTLLWNRDLLVHNNRGHVDLPRLQQGNVTLQLFSVVTGAPLPFDIRNNHDRLDSVSLLARVQDWPDITHSSRLQRALYQANKLRDWARQSNGKLKLVRNREDLDKLLAARSGQDNNITGAMLALEGAHALEGDVQHLATLHQAGFRVLGLAHFFDNTMAGSAHGTNRHGLTENGRTLVRQALKLGMVIDISHASAKTIDDVLTITDKPVIASHGGVRSTCDTPRNLDDNQVRKIAARGGVIGVGLFAFASCGHTLDDTVKAMRYIADLVGIEHVALGSDFDGATEAVIDVSGLVLLTEALQRAGFQDKEISMIMGGNSLRVLRDNLPAN